MLELQLDNASIKRNFPIILLENGQCLRFCGGSKGNVNSSRYTEEKIHRFMEVVLCQDNEDEQTVSKEGKDIGDARGDRKPHM